jgi:hypothetical protein
MSTKDDFSNKVNEHKLRESQTRYYRKLNSQALCQRMEEIQKVVDRESFKLETIRRVMDECRNINENIDIVED